MIRRNGERVGVIIQARFASSRLPRKAFLDLDGMPLLARLTSRMRCCKSADGVVVATADTRDNDPIDDLCRNFDIPVHRGPEVDLATRMIGAARKFDFDAMVRVTGDNPFTDFRAIDSMIDEYRRNGFDAVHNYHAKGWPYGTGAQLFRTSMLEDCAKSLASEVQRENVFTVAMSARDRYRIRRFDAPPELLRPNYFLTVDYPEDLELARRIAGQFSNRIDVDLESIIELLDARRELAALNAYLHHPFAQ